MMDPGIQYLNNYISDRSYKGPTLLYKYRPFDRFAFDMLVNQYLYLCPPKDLDDPTECEARLDPRRFLNFENDNLKRDFTDLVIESIKDYSSPEALEILNRIRNVDGTINVRHFLDISDIYASYFGKNFDKVEFANLIVNGNAIDDPKLKRDLENHVTHLFFARTNMGVCSLSANKNDQYMWKNYACNGSGYCIEFNIDGYEFANRIFPVVYVDKEKRETDILAQLLKSIFGEWIYQLSRGEKHPDRSQAMQLLLTKNKEWSYQNEWRLLGDANAKEKAPNIKTIYLGDNVSDENKAKMEDFTRKRGIPLLIRDTAQYEG